MKRKTRTDKLAFLNILKNHEAVAEKKKREQGKVYKITKTVRGKYRTGTSNAPIADKKGIPLITQTEKKVDGQIISAGTLEAGQILT